MSRRRFIGKSVAGTGGAITVASLGYSFAEGRQTHLDEDYVNVSDQETQDMRAFDRRQWKKALKGLFVAGAGVVTVFSGIRHYDSGIERTSDTPNDSPSTEI